MMINGIGNQVSFRSLTSEDLNQRLNLSPVLQQTPQLETSPANTIGAQPTGEETPNKSSHKFLKTIVALAVLGGAGYAAKKGKLGKKAKELFDRTHEPVKKFCKEKVKPKVDAVVAKIKSLTKKAEGETVKATDDVVKPAATESVFVKKDIDVPTGPCEHEPSAHE